MGVRFVCDGCGDIMEPGVEPKRLGKVIRREYCECCADAAETHLAEVDKLHDEIAIAWNSGISSLRKAAHEAGLDLLPDSTSTLPQRDRDHEVEVSA